ncbi:TPA: hypothetical protein SE795_001755, partial [Campylobacter jejuni]|nr:hypothetical protein [Campylobacter jejuni]
MKDILRLALENWDFELIDKLYDSESIEYVYFLYNTGQLRKLYILIKDKDLNIFSEDIKKLYQDYDIIRNLNINTFEDSLNLNDICISRDIMSCYLIEENLKINKKLDPQQVLFLISKYILHSQNEITWAYFISLAIDYFKNENSQNKLYFFIPQYSSCIQYHILTKLFYGVNGAKKYYNIFLENIYNILKNITVFNKKPKVAICFFGALRGDWKSSLTHSFQNIAEELNADCFLSTWNEVQLWPGLMGGGNWVKRFFGDRFKQEELDWFDNQFLKKNMPTTYACLEAEYLYKIDRQELFNLKNNFKCFKDFQLHDLDAFETSLKNTPFFYQLCNKIYYGIKMAFDVMVKYENKHNIKYDYVFILRADAEFYDISQDILNLNFNEIADGFFSWGSGSLCSYGLRQVMQIYASMYDYIDEMIKFNIDPCNNHDFIFKWMTLHNIKTAPFNFKIQFQSSCLSGIKFPDKIEEMLLYDINRLKKENKLSEIKINKIEIFFCYLIKSYGKINLNCRKVVKD